MCEDFKDRLNLPSRIDGVEQGKKKPGGHKPPRRVFEARLELGTKLDDPALVATQGSSPPAIFCKVLDPGHLVPVGRTGVNPGRLIVGRPGGQFRQLPLSLGHEAVSPPFTLRKQPAENRGVLLYCQEDFGGTTLSPE